MALMVLFFFIFALSPSTLYAQTTPNASISQALAEQYVTLFQNGDYDALPDLFTSPSSTYWLNGSPARVPQAGDSTVAERAAGFASFLGAFDNFTLTVTNLVADSNGAIVEATARGEGPGTFLYLQTLVWVFSVKNDKLDSLREYIDHQETQYLLTYLDHYPQAPHCE